MEQVSVRGAGGLGHEIAEWETAVAPVDRDNTARLREIVGQHVWPDHRLVGEAGAHAAWLLAQHAPPDLQEQWLGLIAGGDRVIVDRCIPYQGSSDPRSSALWSGADESLHQAGNLWH
jgi:hypothetical protein